jgi:hypothetical protein
VRSFSTLFAMNKLKVEKSERSLRREAHKSNQQLKQSLSDTIFNDFIATKASVDVAVDMPCENSDSDMPDFFPEGMPPIIEGHLDANIDLRVGERWLCDSSDSDSDTDLSDTISHELATWAVTYHIPLTATGALLAILKPHIQSLPKDPRTLLKTPTHYSVKKMCGGEYSYLGLAKGLSHFVTNSVIEGGCLELQINIDGIPLFKSSSSSLWPILCFVMNAAVKEPFVVGVFYGKEKPDNAADFLSDFVMEVSDLIANGINVGNKTYGVSIHSFVCDAPARAFVKGTKSHSGYSSCEKCTIHGDYAGKVIFTVADSPLRTDESFKAMIDEDHHVAPCPLNPLPIGFVTQFGLDYMHLACLGVMRRLLLYWKGPVGPLHVRLGRQDICEVSTRLLNLTAHVPLEFARRPRTLDDLPRWKATEFREFLLYTGQIVLKGILSDKLYDHFMLLCVSMRLLASSEQCLDRIDYANELLRNFVHDAANLYGKEILVYNVHSLLHLSDDVKRLGCLDNFSAFVFENKLGQLKKLIRNPHHVIEQLLRRLDEQKAFGVPQHKSYEQPVAKSEHMLGPLLPQYRGGRQFTHVQTTMWTLSRRTGNNCVLLENHTVAIVKNIVKTKNDIILLCCQFDTVCETFTSPLNSEQLKIYMVSGETSSLFAVKIGDVLQKCVCCPCPTLGDKFIVIPLLH